MREPRSLTLLDLVGMVAGAALALAMPPGGLAGPGGYTPSAMLAAFVVWLFCGAMSSVSGAVLFRLARYGRPARAAEWLATLIGLAPLAWWALPNVETAVTEMGLVRPGEPASNLRWPVAGVSVAAAGLILFVLARLGPRLPHAARFVGLSAVAVVLLWGPISVLRLESNALWPGWGKDPEWPFWFSLALRDQIGGLAGSLLFLVPLFAALADRGGPEGRGRLWTEWAGLAWAGLCLALMILGFLPNVRIYLGQPAGMAIGWVAGHVVGLAIAVWLARRIVRHVGPSWRRMAGSPSPATALPE